MRKASSVTVADMNTRCFASAYEPKAASGATYGSISTVSPESTHWQCSSMSFSSGQANLMVLRSALLERIFATSLTRALHAQ